MMLILGLQMVKQRLGVVENWQANKSTKVEVLPSKKLAIEPVASYKVASAYIGKIAAQTSSDLGFGTAKNKLFNW